MPPALCLPRRIFFSQKLLEQAWIVAGSMGNVVYIYRFHDHTIGVGEIDIQPLVTAHRSYGNSVSHPGTFSGFLRHDR